MEILLGVLVVAVVTAAVVYPLLRPAPVSSPDPVGPAARLQALEERKSSLYEAIRDLGFDYRTDKLLEEDYREEVDRLKAEAAGVLQEIDKLRSAPPRGPDEVEAEVTRLRAALESGAREGLEESDGGRFCTRCGRRSAAGDRFCASCGTPLRDPR